MMAISDTETYLSASAVALKLGVNRRTVNDWREKGILKAALRLPGGEYRYKASEVEDLKRKLTNATTEA
jgi:DNA-binding transcriptional MerR regulator